MLRARTATGKGKGSFDDSFLAIVFHIPLKNCINVLPLPLKEPHIEISTI